MNLNLVIQSILSSTAKLGTEQTVHSPLFFRKIIEFESFALRGYPSCMSVKTTLGAGGGLGGGEKNIYFSRPAEL